MKQPPKNKKSEQRTMMDLANIHTGTAKTNPGVLKAKEEKAKNDAAIKKAKEENAKTFKKAVDYQRKTSKQKQNILDATQMKNMRPVFKRADTPLAPTPNPTTKR